MISITQKPFKLHTGHSKEKIRTNLQGCTLLWRVSLSLAEEIQLNKENNHGSSFHYRKRICCLFFSEQPYIIHHLSHLQTLPHMKNTIQEGHLILQRIKSIFRRLSIDIGTWGFTFHSRYFQTHQSEERICPSLRFCQHRRTLWFEKFELFALQKQIS